VFVVGVLHVQIAIFSIKFTYFPGRGKSIHYCMTMMQSQRLKKCEVGVILVSIDYNVTAET